MKPGKKREPVDILFFVLLILVMAANTVGCSPDQPAGDDRYGNFLISPSPDEIAGIWDVELIINWDSGQEKSDYSAEDAAYEITEMVFDIRHLSGKDYAVNVIVKDEQIGEPSPFGGDTSAEVAENGMLRFRFAFDKKTVFDIAFKKESGGLTGIAYLIMETGDAEEAVYSYLTLEKRL